MPRTALGVRPQPETSTALFAYFSARLAGVPAREYDEYFEKLGIQVKGDSAVRAASSAKLASAEKKRPGRSRKEGTERPPSLNAFRDWLLVDELRLQLSVALVTFPGSGRRQTDLIAALERTPACVKYKDWK